jgi:hypothetical protein
MDKKIIAIVFFALMVFALVFADLTVDVKVDLGNNSGQTQPSATIEQPDNEETTGLNVDYETSVLPEQAKLYTEPQTVLVENTNLLELTNLRLNWEFNGSTAKAKIDEVNLDKSSAEILVCVNQEPQGGNQQANASCTTIPSGFLEKYKDKLRASVPVEKIREFVINLGKKPVSISITPQISVTMNNGSEQDLAATPTIIEESQGNALDFIVRMNKKFLRDILGEETEKFPKLKVIPKSAGEPWNKINGWDGKTPIKICYESKSIEWGNETTEEFSLKNDTEPIVLFESLKGNIPKENWDCITLEGEKNEFVAKSDSKLPGTGNAINKELFDSKNFPNGFVFEVKIKNGNEMVVSSEAVVKVAGK